jgi:hypothetical protein
MKTIACRLLTIALLVPTALDAPVALGGYRENLAVTDVEIAQLPKFCWMQMEVPGASGPEYKINACGSLVNHYCPGLLYLIRSKSSANKSRRVSLLEHASIDIGYTEQGIKEYPQCSIRGHVAAARAEVNTLMSIYANKRPKTSPAAP